MSNDITGIQSGKIQPGSDRVAGSAKGNSASHGSQSVAAPTAAQSSGDKVSLTATAAQLKSLEQELTTQPEIDTKRVEDIQLALTSGEYRIDPDHIASKLIGFEGDFSKD